MAYKQRPWGRFSRLAFESCEPRRVLAVLPAMIPPAEAVPACALPGAKADRVKIMTDAEWNSLDTGPHAHGVPGTLDPAGDRSPTQLGSVVDVPPLPVRHEVGGPVPGTPQHPAPEPGTGLTGGRPGADLFSAGAAIGIERREWTSAITVRYPLYGESPVPGGPAGTGGRREEPSLAFIDVGRVLGGPTKILRKDPIRTPRTPAAAAEALVAERTSGPRADASDVAPPSIKPPARGRPSPSNASRSQSMMLLASTAVPAAEPSRPEPAMAPTETPAAEAKATPRAVPPHAVPTAARTGQLEPVVRPLGEESEAGESALAPALVPDDPTLRRSLAGLVVLTLLASQGKMPCRHAGGEAHGLQPRTPKMPRLGTPSCTKRSNGR